VDLGFEGKRALVASSSRGLGYAVARGLAVEGCDVFINSRSEEHVRSAVEALRRETNARIAGSAGDVSDAQTPARIVEAAAKAMGGVDLLVTNSGGPPGGQFESLTEEQWMQAINLVFLSHVRLIRAALPYLRQSKSASVLTMTSWTVKFPMPNLVLSNSIRSATIGLTKTLALELGAQGIRFNSILPAAMDTDRMRELQSMRAQRSGTTPEEEAARDASNSVLGRMGRPEEFANVAVFLLSPAASYVTGLMMTVDGGQYKGTF
jgi:3-oxoacyl-[acyl-carrier protein] reductase